MPLERREALHSYDDLTKFQVCPIDLHSHDSRVLRCRGTTLFDSELRLPSWWQPAAVRPNCHTCDDRREGHEQIFRTSGAQADHLKPAPKVVLDLTGATTF